MENQTINRRFFCCIFIVIIPLIIISLALGIVFQSSVIVNLMEIIYPRAVIHFDKYCDRKAVAFTIDDSITSHTSYLVELLKQYNSTATFCMMGRKVRAFSSHLKYITEAGNDICNHMFDYDAAIFMTEEQFKKDLNRTEEIFDEELFVNNVKKWFRPASFLAKNYMFDVLKEKNYTMLLGNVHSFDSQIRNTKYNLMNLIGRIHTGDVIIVHDISESIEYIEQLLSYLKHENFEICSVSEMFKRCPMKIPE